MSLTDLMIETAIQRVGVIPIVMIIAISFFLSCPQSLSRITVHINLDIHMINLIGFKLWEKCI